MSARDEFPEKVKKILQERVGNRCSNPDCRCLTSGPNTRHDKATRIGVAAHITAASANGPRYDPILNKEERSSILNGVWLCQNCSKLVDSDANFYTTNLLQRWKSHSEDLARIEIEGGKVKPEHLHDGYYCPHCDSFSKVGVTVCLGCDSDIYYGSTPHERLQDFQAGVATSAFGLIFIFLLLPILLNDWFGIEAPLLWGMNFFVTFAIGLMVSLFYGHHIANKNDNKRLSNPPRFFRKRH